MWKSSRNRTIAILALLAALSGCSLLPKEIDDVPPPIEPPQRSIKELFTVRRGDIAEQVPLRVMAAPASESTLFFQQAGRIRAVHAKAGDAVQAGQLLAELETGDLLTNIELAEINLEKLRIRLQQSTERAESPGGPDRHDLAILELDLRAAEINLSVLRTRLEDAQLYASFSGHVTAVTGQVGDHLQPFQPLLTMSDPTITELRAEVDDATVPKLVAGQRAMLTFPDLGDRMIEAKLVQVGEPGAQGRGRVVRFATDQAEPALQQGMAGRAVVVLQAKSDVLLLPHAAVRSYAGRSYVLVMEEGSRREVDIAVGIVGETETEVLKGLKEGQQVIGR